jgi:homoserine dehydrogenase
MFNVHKTVFSAGARPEIAKNAGPDGNLLVIKFGGSVLRSPQSVPAVASEIYAYVRRGKRVVAVVSAFLGETDQLLSHASELSCAHEEDFIPPYVTLGEQRAVELVSMVCDRIGLRAFALDVRGLRLVAQGAPLSAQPLRLDTASLRARLENYDVIVVPGFAGVCEAGRINLLGRGGTDLTAVFIARELGLSCVRLIKDVDGLYDCDPHRRADARLYDRISWSNASEVAVPLVQPQAIEMAQVARLEIEVAALASPRCSVIGAHEHEPHAPTPYRPMRVAIAGCGIVGGGLYERLRSEPDKWEIGRILVRDASKSRTPQPPVGLLSADTEQLLESRPDVLVDCLSDGQAGAELVHQALARGIHVVSANKQALVGRFDRFAEVAGRSGARLLYSGAVGGGAPMIEALRRCRAEGAIESFEAVLNGTVNFILCRMEMGLPFEDSLRAARAVGFAEEDPRFDLEGCDALAKLRILAREAFRCDLPPDVPCEGLSRDVRRCGRYRQIARCWRSNGSLLAEVRLEQISAGSPFFDLKGERNMLVIRMADGMTSVVRGRGAGRWPTTESLYADLVDLRALIES